jgi:sugar phosphate isomerase/epimerase
MTTNMNRRRFIGSAVAAAAAMAPAPVISEQAQQSEAAASFTGPMRISVFSYSFRGLLREGRMNVFGYLETCKYRYNLQAADLWNSGSGFLASMEESYLKKVRDAYEERAMVCPALAVDGAHVWSDDANGREKRRQVALAHLKAAAIIGARFVRFDAGGSGSEWSNEAFDFIVKRYKEYCQIAYDNGFKMGPENHGGPEAYISSLKKLMDAVDHPGLGLSHHLDGFRGTPEEKRAADKEAAKWTCATHIPWNVTESGLLVERMTFLRDAGYQGYYSVEHHTGRDEYAEVAIQLAKVRAVLESFRTGGTGGSLGPRTPRRGQVRPVK